MAGSPPFSAGLKIISYHVRRTMWRNLVSPPSPPSLRSWAACRSFFSKWRSFTPPRAVHAVPPGLAQGPWRQACWPLATSSHGWVEGVRFASTASDPDFQPKQKITDDNQVSGVCVCVCVSPSTQVALLVALQGSNQPTAACPNREWAHFFFCHNATTNASFLRLPHCLLLLHTLSCRWRLPSSRWRLR